MNNIKKPKDVNTKTRKTFGFFNKKEQEVSLFILLVVLIIIFSSSTEHFFAIVNFRTIFSNVSVIGIISIGFAVVLISGNIDLSVGAITALTGSIIVFLIYFFPNLSIWVIFLICLVVGILFGALNGFIVTKVRLNTVITTLATMSIIRGIAYVFNAYYIYLDKGTDQGLIRFTRIIFIEFIPISLIYLIMILIIFIFILTRTKFGRGIYATGDEINSARLMGIKTNQIQFWSFIISAICATIAGIILVGQIGIGRADNAIGSEFEAITIVVLGGIAIKGGKGNLIGVLFAMLIFATITNGLVHLGYTLFWKEILKGVILILAVSIEAIRSRRSLFQTLA